MAEPEPFADEEQALCARAMGYPGAVEEFPWGHRAIKVRGKIFATVVTMNGELAVTVKLPDSHPYALTQPYARPAGYGLGKHGWVTCTFRVGDAVPLDLLEEWFDESYRAVAPKKLVLALNARLGGSEPPLMPPPPKPKPPAKPKVPKKPRKKK